ncbi:hypothetical protein N7504_001097 [Penicillium tannophilum]|nr:hypothetical protein N7504_001097 [Penicillium tannophilum]
MLLYQYTFKICYSVAASEAIVTFNAALVIGDVAASCIAMDSELVRSRTMESDEESHPEGAEAK